VGGAMNNILELIENTLTDVWIRLKSLFTWIPKTVLSLSILTIFIISVNSGDYAKAFAAIGTVSAVIWALYHQEIKWWIERPKLEIEGFKMDIPFFRRIPKELPADTVMIEKTIDASYYINIPIINIGKRSAKNCTPILISYSRLHKGKWENEINWIPLPLKWAADERELTDREFTTREISLNQLNYKETSNKIPKVERDIIPHRPYFFNLGVFNNKSDFFRLLTVMDLKAQDHEIKSGEYLFEIKIIAEEIEPITKYLYFSWNGVCTSNFEDMKRDVKLEIREQ
jgi:drug/metabolite transporter superfamily protein YnfA